MARIQHLEERHGRWYFLFGPEEGESFETVLQRFKWRIPLSEREWHDDMTRWSVAISDENHARLALLFPNFSTALQALKNQLSLFAL